MAAEDRGPANACSRGNDAGVARRKTNSRVQSIKGEVLRRKLKPPGLPKDPTLFSARRSAGGEARLAGLWGHERGRVQAAPKHGVHGLAQRSNPYGKHPFQDVRRPAARGRADEAMATGNTAAPCWRLKARPRSRHRTAAPTGSPKNNRDQAIGRSAGWGRSPTGGLSVGLRRAAPR